MEHDYDRMPDEDERLVQRYVDGELPEADADELEQRLDREPELRSQADAALGLSSFFDAAREDQPGRLGVGFGDRLWTKVQQEESNRETHGTIRMLKSLTLAAACALFVLGIVLFASARPERPGQLFADPSIERRLQELDRKADRDEERKAPNETPAAGKHSARSPGSSR